MKLKEKLIVTITSLVVILCVLLATCWVMNGLGKGVFDIPIMVSVLGTLNELMVIFRGM